MGSQRHAPAALLPGKKSQYPLYGRLGGPQGRSGPSLKISPTPGSEPRVIQPVTDRHTEYVMPAEILAYTYIPEISGIKKWQIHQSL
jgi:hypothetical protein